MIRDITIGQFYKENSIIHRLDPRTKLAITFWYLISLFISNNIFGYIFASIALFTYVKLSKVPLKYIVKGLKPIFIIILFTGVMNLISTPGETLLKLGFINITSAGIKSSIFISIRMIFIIIGSSIMTYATTPTALTDGIEKSFNWLNKFKVPVHEMAMMMSIAIRFIPILIEELDRIMKAQMARGATFNTGNIFKRIKAMTPIIVPLFVAAIRRSNDLALAMDARCYRGGEGRTKLKPLKYLGIDKIAYVILALYFMSMIAIVILL